MRFKIEMEVEVDEETHLISMNDAGEIEYCGFTGDSYNDSLDFFQHQLDRDLQVIRPILDSIKVKVSR